MIELTLDNIKQYLISKKLIERTEIISVDDVDNGGFINRIFIIKIANKKKQRSLVIKQFLDCATSCPINPRVERAKYEVEALKLIPKYLGDEAIIPKVIFADLKNNLFIMNEAPHKNGTYKQQILNHEFNLNIPYKIGRFHALLHSKTFKKKEVKERLQNNPGYYDLRFEASFKYPAEKNKRLLAKLKPFFEKMLSNKLCLIHADTTPKNILVQADIITIVDWEAATYGDPAHDVGITFAHYIMYACNNPEKAELCLLSGKIHSRTYSFSRLSGNLHSHHGQK